MGLQLAGYWDSGGWGTQLSTMKRAVRHAGAKLIETLRRWRTSPIVVAHDNATERTVIGCTTPNVDGVA